MTGLLIFFSSVLGSLIDPFNLIGYIIAGAVCRTVWGALGAAAGWALLMELLTFSLADNVGLDYRVLYPERLVGALIASGIVFAIANKIRKKTEVASLPSEHFPTERIDTCTNCGKESFWKDDTCPECGFRIKTEHSEVHDAATSLASNEAKTQRERFQDFIDILSSMDAEELGLPVATAADFRNRLAGSGLQFSDPKAVLTKYPDLTSNMLRQVEQQTNDGQNREAMQSTIWAYSLLAISRPELRSLGREMWGQPERGFKYADQAADDFQQSTGQRLETKGAADFPKGLTPQPLD